LQREQSYMQAELKRKEIETAAATEIQKQQIEANFKMQAIDRREIERYQEKEKEMLERELHTRMELEKLKYEAKTRSLEQKLKEKSQLLSSIQKGVPSEVFGSRLATERETIEHDSMVGGSTVRIMAATSSFGNPNRTHSVSTMSSSPVCTQSLFQGPPPLFTPYPSHLLEPMMPTSALPTVVKPTCYAAPSHNVVATSVTGLGGNVAPVTLLMEQGTQPTVVPAAQTILSTATIATCNAIASSITQIPNANITMAIPSAPASATEPITAAAPAQVKPADASAQASAGSTSNQSTSAPVVIVKQPQPVKPYSGQTSYKGFKEYFARLALCNGWTTKVEKAQNLLVAMEGAAAEAVRGLMVTQDSDYDAIWDALARRFGHMDEPERAMRLFDVAKQADHESLALFEQNLRTLYREAWP